MNFQFLKSKRFYIIFGVALVFLILLNAVFSSSSPVPYYPQSIFAKQFPYNREGLSGIKEGYDEEEEEEPPKEGLTDGTANNDEDEEDDTEGNKKENFQGLDGGNFNSEQYMGYLANVKTGGNCASTSNGLSTSTGYLCLSPDEIRYLQSRGGNATSKGDF